jgi:hypothetical protein
MTEPTAATSGSPQPSSGDTFSSNELFRYARVRPPRIIDLRWRGMRSEALHEILERPTNEQRAWAISQLESGERSVRIEDLRFDYLSHLTLQSLPADRLPMAADIKDPAAFDADRIRGDEWYKADRERLLLRVAALRIAEGASQHSSDLKDMSRLMDFVEMFPDLARVKTREPYATVVLERAKVRIPKAPQRQMKTAEQGPAPADELKQVAGGLHMLWRARNRYLQDLKREYKRARREIIRLVPELPPLADRQPQAAPAGQPVKANPSAYKGAEATAQRSADASERLADQRVNRALLRDRAEAHSLVIRERTAALRALNERYEEDLRRASLEHLLASTSAADEGAPDGWRRLGRWRSRGRRGGAARGGGAAATIARYVSGRSELEVTKMIAMIRDFEQKYDIPAARFCEAYEAAVARAEAAGVMVADEASELSDCYAEYPNLVFADTVRILGEADLITVDETFVKYTAGEISYVENVLAGEVRKRRVKTARYLEQSTEMITEETTDASKETSGSTRQELKSQVETELNTRLESDISASANASGGGSIGLVEVQGGGSVDASLGVGLDQNLATSNESQFSQEIVSKALERTKRSVIERRLSRSYSLDETMNLHAIHNDVDGAKSFNGVYCFLNKHVAITESVYGRRMFLLANIHAPGRSLLCARLQRLQLALEDVGAKPLFDITPADITPANYMLLAGRFKVQNVAPPPAPVITLGRTYKTDATNTNAESDEFNGRKIAEVLVPYFARYKRFLIAENVRLPEGYEVMDVTVTVNHGANGISIPADLPLRAGGAMALAAPALVAYGGYGPFLLPVWLWSIGFLASPILHYNCDSSNVTIGIGAESEDSPYYFFDPDALIRELFTLFGSASAVLPSILEEIEQGIEPLMTELALNAGQVPSDAADAVTSAVGVFINALKAIFDDIINARFDKAVEKLANLGFEITTQQLDNLSKTMGSLFEPFRGFIQRAIDLITGALGTAVVDLFTYFMELSDSSQTFSFTAAQGTRGELPVSFNTVAIKPGVTINMSACLRRTDEALERWQLETFANFYRAHLQLVADYESKSFIAGANSERVTKPSATLRAEEHAAVKERVLFTLNNVHGTPGNSFTFDRMNLFEHALDWPNMTFRVFNYGPTADEIRLEKRGAFLGADERRRAFTTALWAQVMIPISGNPHYVEQVMRYFEDGTFSFEGTLQNEELVALYRDFVLGRETEPIEVSEPRFEIVPTELIVLHTDDLDTVLPKNPAFA